MVNRLLQTAVLIGAAFVLSALLFWQVDIIHRGGPVMIFILMCSIFSLGIVLERLYYFLRIPEVTTARLERLREAVSAQRWEGAMAVCREVEGPIANVVRVGLSVPAKSPEAMEQAMEEAAVEELPHVHQHLRWLSTIAQVSTLLGLLGTVTGMVRTFQVIQEKTVGTAPVNPGDLAGGIWEALLTTVAGLIVAIPTIVAYNYFQGRVAELQSAMERVATMVIGWASARNVHAASSKTR